MKPVLSGSNLGTTDLKKEIKKGKKSILTGKEVKKEFLGSERR